MSSKIIKVIYGSENSKIAPKLAWAAAPVDTGYARFSTEGYDVVCLLVPRIPQEGELFDYDESIKSCTAALPYDTAQAAWGLTPEQISGLPLLTEYHVDSPSVMTLYSEWEFNSEDIHRITKEMHDSSPRGRSWQIDEDLISDPLEDGYRIGLTGNDNVAKSVIETSKSDTDEAKAFERVKDMLS